MMKLDPESCVKADIHLPLSNPTHLGPILKMLPTPLPRLHACIYVCRLRTRPWLNSAWWVDGLDQWSMRVERRRERVMVKGDRKEERERDLMRFCLSSAAAGTSLHWSVSPCQRQFNWLLFLFFGVGDSFFKMDAKPEASVSEWLNVKVLWGHQGILN